jgi:hypothetical protein
MCYLLFHFYPTKIRLFLITMQMHSNNLTNFNTNKKTTQLSGFSLKNVLTSFQAIIFGNTRGIPKANFL